MEIFGNFLSHGKVQIEYGLKKNETGRGELGRRRAQEEKI
jgi:hypothetical protein